MRDIKPKTEDYMVGGGPGKLSKKKADPIYPHLRLDLDTLPEAKKWEIGKEYSVALTLKMVGISISKYDNSADFEIRQIGGKDVKPEAGDAVPADDGD